jgi:MFS family permease
MIDTVRTMFFPNIIWVIVINSLFISIQGAAAQTGSSVLIAAGFVLSSSLRIINTNLFHRWKFKTLGLAVVPIVVATPFVWFLGGFLADKVSNTLARRNGGRREPEAHLLNLILPLIFGITGCVLFGYAGQNINTTHWSVLLTGIFLIALAFLTANTVLSVYIVESYPQWAGYVPK